MRFTTKGTKVQSAQDNSVKSKAKSFDVEVDDKAKVELQKLQVCQHLSSMDWKNLGGRLHLYDHQPSNDHVCTIATLYFHASISQGQGDLALETGPN